MLGCPGALPGIPEELPASLHGNSWFQGDLTPWDAAGSGNSKLPFPPPMGKGVGSGSWFSPAQEPGCPSSTRGVSHWNEPSQIPEKPQNQFNFSLGSRIPAGMPRRKTLGSVTPQPKHSAPDPHPEAARDRSIPVPRLASRGFTAGR